MKDPEVFKSNLVISAAAIDSSTSTLFAASSVAEPTVQLQEVQRLKTDFPTSLPSAAPTEFYNNSYLEVVHPFCYIYPYI